MFNLEVDLIFYDTTTVSFSIDDEDEDGNEGEFEEGLRKYGHSKSGVWSPRIVVALAVTREGIPVRCWVFKGNMSDVRTVERIRKDLRKWKLGRALFVADSGMNSEENRVELARACGKYLLASRMATVGEVKRDVLSKRGPYRVIRDNLHAIEVIQQCFRSLKKTRIKMEPVYHWSPRRIESHIKICVLSLLIQRIAELACQMPWNKIRNILERLQVTECQTSSHVFFKLNEISREVREVFKKAEILLPKGVLGIKNLP